MFKEPDSRARALSPQQQDKPPQRDYTAPHIAKATLIFNEPKGKARIFSGLIRCIEESRPNSDHDLATQSGNGSKFNSTGMTGSVSAVMARMDIDTKMTVHEGLKRFTKKKKTPPIRGHDVATLSGHAHEFKQGWLRTHTTQVGKA